MHIAVVVVYDNAKEDRSKNEYIIQLHLHDYEIRTAYVGFIETGPLVAEYLAVMYKNRSYDFFINLILNESSLLLFSNRNRPLPLLIFHRISYIKLLYELNQWLSAITSASVNENGFS
jgi:hypothetical protein